MDVSSLRCLLHLLVSGQDPSIADVVGDGVIEEHRVLGHHPDVSAQRRLLHLGRQGEGAQPDLPLKMPPNQILPLSHEPNTPLIHTLSAPGFSLDHRLSCISILWWGDHSPSRGALGSLQHFSPWVP